MHFRLGKNPEESLTTGWREEDVALTPKNDCLGWVIFEECLPLRVEFDVGPVIVEQIELHLFCVGAFEKVVVNVPVVWTDELWLGMAGCVNSVDGGWLQETCDSLLGFGRTALPVIGP